eukprot:TRINITY_DN7298_c0_g2_i7.p1 TRINITY_DN7298_c0_g2~~TRINITY_DN7298_c0_g2_i7.p1  ORF type:complete len:284 (-),score=85.51 TRINITY_DN7298_c0_g2_i7:377-1228(-)
MLQTLQTQTLTQTLTQTAEAKQRSAGIMPYLKAYLSLLRFSYHQNFAVVIIGAMSNGLPMAGASATATTLLQLYFSFNICLYGALYAINAITDKEEDSNHPEKRKRPVASGFLSVQHAICFVAGLLTVGFSTGYLWFGARVCQMYVLFIALNLVYSMAMRNMKFMRFWTAGLTCPCRLHLGAMVLGAQPALPIYFLAYFFMTALQSSKIRIENRKLKTEVNGFKPGVVEGVSFVGTAIALYFNYPNNKVIATLCVIQNIVYIVLPNLSSGAEKALRKYYTCDC